MSSGDPRRAQAALDRQIEIGAVDADKELRRHSLLLRNETPADAQQFWQTFQWFY
tara:strand:- start:60 stop:224 length:165 start_codon:yes stop_codon:yes gene_type:complete